MEHSRALAKASVLRAAPRAWIAGRRYAMAVHGSEGFAVEDILERGRGVWAETVVIHEARAQQADRHVGAPKVGGFDPSTQRLRMPYRRHPGTRDGSSTDGWEGRRFRDPSPPQRVQHEMAYHRDTDSAFPWGDLTLVRDAHTTSPIELDDGRMIAAQDIVTELNVAMTWLRYPGRTNRTVAAAEVEFGPYAG